jgi:uncharacterized protein with ATP-grasp and redox domains
VWPQKFAPTGCQAMKSKLSRTAADGIGFVPHLDCVPCMLRQAREAIAFTGVETELGFGVLRQVLRLMAQLDWNLPPPVLGQQVHRLIRELTGCSDPYAAVKQRMNQRAAEGASQYLGSFGRENLVK